MLTLHTYGNQSLYPFDAGGARAERRRPAVDRVPVQPLQRVQTADQAGITGSTDLYAYNTVGIAALMFEIGPGSGTCSGFHPAYSCQDGFWDLNRDAFLYAARLAQEPYVMGWGPNTLEAKSKIKSATAGRDHRDR